MFIVDAAADIVHAAVHDVASNVCARISSPTGIAVSCMKDSKFVKTGRGINFVLIKAEDGYVDNIASSRHNIVALSRHHGHLPSHVKPVLAAPSHQGVGQAALAQDRFWQVEGRGRGRG